jgi:hypothetical protein
MRWHPFKRQRKQLYVVVRDRKVWAGPYRWRGGTFTGAQRYWYPFNSVDNARVTAEGCGISKYEIVPIDLMIDAT